MAATASALAVALLAALCAPLTASTTATSPTLSIIDSCPIPLDETGILMLLASSKTSLDFTGFDACGDLGTTRMCSTDVYLGGKMVVEGAGVCLPKACTSDDVNGSPSAKEFMEVNFVALTLARVPLTIVATCDEPGIDSSSEVCN